MQDTIPVGKVGSLTLSFSGGKANIGFTAQLPGGLGTQVMITEDASVLLGLLGAELQKLLPAAAPVIAAVMAVLESTVNTIG